ncbi:DUF1054 family protein [Vagococcus elongatus]|uniref:UPF0637 protein CBF29_04900 n=1 Tax=Vagococcus elongatus TaxID=180344 RepID=A0A430AY61_9ENTE|nr:DUF1054 domain-containing protein [Vagococcus elongatus]RSU13011.1 hypothetical protein CBF29_04900 [Vagococcus elongatus]
MFSEKSFDVFEIPGLEERMAAIRAEIQPKFQELDDYFIEELEPLLGEKLMLHIAQHRRRTTHAPESTWSAMGGNKRGYKKFPHFQLTINNQYIGMWLSFIDNPEFEKEMAQFFLENQDSFKNLSEDFVVSLDHTKETIERLEKVDLEKALIRWRDVKKGEFMIGRIIKKEDKILKDHEASRKYMLETYQQLVPFYQAAFLVRE